MAVIYHDFGKKSVPKVDAQSSEKMAGAAKPSKSQLDESIENRAFVIANQALVKEMSDKAKLMRRQGVLSGFENDDFSIRMRRKRFKENTLKELCDAIRCSRENEWKIQPIYHFALSLEFLDRVEAVERLSLR